VLIHIDLKCVYLEDHGSPQGPSYRPQRMRRKAKERLRERDLFSRQCPAGDGLAVVTSKDGTQHWATSSGFEHKIN